MTAPPLGRDLPRFGILPPSEQSAESWKEAVSALYEEPRTKSGGKASALSFRWSPKGNPVITVRGRKPKWATPEELDSLADTTEGVSRRELWLWAGEKGIEVRRGSSVITVRAERRTNKRGKG